MSKGKILKKQRWVFGNFDYPALIHYPEVVLYQKGRYRITEQTYEYLERMYGYKPTPEVATRRRIQSKFLWWWTTLSEHKARLPTMDLIRASCFGEHYEYEPYWVELGFGEETLSELIRKDKK